MYQYTAFNEFNILSRGNLETVALQVRKTQKADSTARILIFSDLSGKQMELDLSGSEKDILERLKVFSQIDTAPATGPGRPKLGVVAREISLLPQHWEWLANQSGGASATVRRLIDEKMKDNPTLKEKAKRAQEVTYNVLSAIAGNLPHYEEAIRFLYRKDRKRFRQLIADWPGDLVPYSMEISEDAFTGETR